MDAALERFFDELRADPHSDPALAQAYEDAMADRYLDANENALSQELYDHAHSIAENSEPTSAEQCDAMYKLMRSVICWPR
jgi:hypothetical protein